MRSTKNTAPDAANIEGGKASPKAETTLPLSNLEKEKSMDKPDFTTEIIPGFERLTPEHQSHFARLIHYMAHEDGFCEAYKDLIAEQGGIPALEETRKFMDHWDKSKKKEEVLQCCNCGCV